MYFNSTNCINVRLTQCVFSVWPVAQPVVREMEMHTVANFFPFKKAPKPYLVSENRVSCCPSAHTPLSLSLSLLWVCVCVVCVSSVQWRSNWGAELSIKQDIILLL